MPRCTIVSFRFGPTDGVSVVARNWANALAGLGFGVDFLAGAVEPGWDDDRPLTLVEGLSVGASGPPKADRLVEVLRGTDLVVVENLFVVTAAVAPGGCGRTGAVEGPYFIRVMALL